MSQQKLTDEDQLKLIFLPLMNSRKSRTDLAVEAVELANQLQDERQRFRLTGTVIAIADKFLDDSYVDKMMGVFKMTRIFQKVYEDAVKEGEVKGIVKAKQEDIRLYLEASFGMASIDNVKKVEQIFELNILNTLLAQLYRADTIKEVNQLVDQALQYQNAG